MESIRKTIPHVAIRTSLIVGYPSETKKRFAELVSFVQEARFENLGVFCYSREEGTPAYILGNRVSRYEKEERRALIMEIQARISFELNQTLVGREEDIIVDSIDGAGKCVGRTFRQSPEIDGVAYIDKAASARVGDIVRGCITSAAEYDLNAVMLR